MKITILVGLPASGKTTYGNTLSGVFIDDISQNNAITILEDCIRNNYGSIIISDVNLCKDSVRKNCESWLNNNAKHFEQEWIYFTNNPEACLKNERQRKLDGDLRKVSCLIKSLSKEYIIPEGVKVISCYTDPYNRSLTI